MEQFSRGETVHAKSGVAYYKASIIDIDLSASVPRYKVHYSKFSPKYDEWLVADSLLKDTKENRVYARKVYADAKNKQKDTKKSGPLKRRNKDDSTDESEDVDLEDQRLKQCKSPHGIVSFGKPHFSAQQLFSP
jgi:hypothetical protein